MFVVEIELSETSSSDESLHDDVEMIEQNNASFDHDQTSFPLEHLELNPEVEEAVSDKDIEEWQIKSDPEDTEDSDKDLDSEDDEDVDEHVNSTYNEEENISSMPKKNNDSEKMDTEDWLNEIMFKASNISVWKVFYMVNTITLKYNLSDEVQQAILNAFKISAGPEFKDLDTSKYFMKKIFNPPQKVISYVFYCPQCLNLLTTPATRKTLSKNKKVMCNKCNTLKRLSLNNDNYFLTLDL